MKETKQPQEIHENIGVWCIDAPKGDSLAELLQCYTVARLTELARFLHLTSLSKMKKGELVEKISGALTQKDVMQQILRYTTPEEYQCLKDLAAGKKRSALPTYPHLYLLEHGCVFLSRTEKGYLLTVPEEVKASIKEARTTKFNKEKKAQDEAVSMLQAMANLYGVFSAEDIKALSPTMGIEPEDFLLLVQPWMENRGLIKHLPQQGLFHSPILSEEGALHLHQLQQNKPHYLPDKEELERYTAFSYHQVTPAFLALKDYIEKNQMTNAENVEPLVRDLQKCTSMEYTNEDLFAIFNLYEVEFKNVQQAKDIASLLIDVHNSTRLWSNNGYTPEEMYALAPKSDHQMRFKPQQPIRVNKIGRNDPCPCGSGKKYKKCCGR